MIERTFDKDDYMTIAQAAVYLKTAASNIYRWIEHGKINHRKLGAKIFVLKTSLDDFLKTGL